MSERYSVIRFLVEIEDYGTGYTYLTELVDFGLINLRGIQKDGRIETYNNEALLTVF